LIALAALTACGDNHTSSVEVSLPVVEARSAAVEQRPIAVRVEVRGVVEAESSAAISSRVTATVTRVRVKAGDRVRRGESLIEIDPATVRGQVGQATGALSQAQAALALAERNYERYRSLAEEEAASELEVDMALMQFRQAQGAVEQAQGAVSAARSVASESSVRAPFDGLVVRRMVEIGDLASPGRPLLMLESEHGRRLSLAVPASLVTRNDLAVGGRLLVHLDSRDDLGTIVATIVERSSAADPMSHSFELKAELPQLEIASGTTGRAWIETDLRPAIVVPLDAVHRQGGLTFVVVVDAERRTESRIVTVGDAVDDSHIEILSGLGGSETVLVGLRSLPPSGSPFEARS
jgi:RND family efflux transporter MFP subunit